MEWLKTSLLVFILFIFAVNNVNSSPIVAASIETKPTVTLADMHEQRVLGPLKDGEKMVKELEKAGLIRQEVPKDPSQSGVGDKQDTVVQRMRRASDYQDSAITNNQHGHSDYESDSRYHSSTESSETSVVLLIVVALAILFFTLCPLGVVACVVYLVMAHVKREQQQMAAPMYIGENRLPNGQIENNLAQKGIATPATTSKTAASRTSATPRSSEVAVEIGMDKKAKTGVSSSNVEENKN